MRPISPSPHFQPIALPLSPRKHAQDHSIPWRGLLPLLLYCVAHLAIYFVIFPFVTDMMTSFDVPHDRIGLYAGVSEGALMIMEAILAPVWAKLADKYGRRPVTIWGFLGCIIPASMLGFSSKPWHVIVWRALSTEDIQAWKKENELMVVGLNPVGVLSRTMVSEMTNPLNRSRVFAIMAPSYAVGAMIGAFAGGEFAHPYGRLPWWLGGNVDLWRSWPYALPCMICGAIGILTTAVALVCLPETRDPMSAGRGSKDEEDQLKKRSSNMYADVLRVPNFLLIMTVFCFFQITCLSYDAIYSVYTYTSTAEGGLGLPVDTIGLIMTSAQLLFVILVPAFLPRMIDRLGSTRTLQVALCTWPILAFSFPTAHGLVESARGPMWVLIALQQAARDVGNCGWPVCDMLIVASFDDYPDLMATGAAIALIAGAGGRAIGPAISGWIYSLSTQSEPGSWGRQASWISFLALSLPPLALVRRLMESERLRNKLEGYEAVPLTANTWDSLDEADSLSGSIREGQLETARPLAG